VAQINPGPVFVGHGFSRDIPTAPSQGFSP
jgi:hypothetical protein